MEFALQILEPQIRKHFKGFGKIESIEMQCNYGFILFADALRASAVLLAEIHRIRRANIKVDISPMSRQGKIVVIWVTLHETRSILKNLA